MIRILVCSIFIFAFSCSPSNSNTNTKNQTEKSIQLISKSRDSTKVQILNLGTFHMDYTTDGYSQDFDEKSAKNRKDITALVQKIAQFKPTVILVELPPERQEELEKRYHNYINSTMTYEDYYGEIGLVAFEVGRLSGTKRIYGIDHKMNYNFMIGDQLINQYPSQPYSDYKTFFENHYIRSDEYKSLSLLDKIRYGNTPEYYNFMINLNADILTYVNSDIGFEGADEAAKFYHRNIRMFANMNKIDFNPNDRVFILMGTAHTAYFDSFFKRSPYYESVNVLEVLN